MSASTTPKALARDLAQAARNLKVANTEGVNDAALFVKKAMLAAAVMDAGGDMRLSNVGKNGARLSVGYTVTAGKALVFARGPWGLPEFGASPHLITSKQGGSRSRRARVLGGEASTKRRGKATVGSVIGIGPVFGKRATGAINISGVGWRKYARHPGTKGKGSWDKQANRINPLLAKKLIRDQTTAVTSAFL
jgi:hypothetical protein